MPRSPIARLGLLGALLLLALAGGCSRKSATSVLTPTGFRPAPANPGGALFGFVSFDPVNTPDITSAPFPYTIVTLSQNGTAVAFDTLAIDSSRFHFEGLPPGTYDVTVNASAFRTGIRTSLLVRDQRIDAGNVTVGLDNAFLNTITAFLTGNIPNFGIDQIGTFESALDQNQLGVWTYPNSLYDPSPIAAGTYRFKLVTDISSTSGNLIGWGGSPSETLQVPFTGHRVARGSGPASDLVARFPTTGVYQITLDERRQSLTIVPAPAALAHRAVRNRP